MTSSSEHKERLPLYPGQNQIKKSMAGDVDSNTIKTIEIQEKDSNEIKQYKKLILDAQEKYQKLLCEHEKTTIELSDEKNKSANMEKRFAFVKDNQERLNRIKDDLKKNKCEESNDKALPQKTIQLNETSTQTLDVILCEYCQNNYILRDQLEKAWTELENSIIVDKNEFEDLSNTIKELKNLIHDFNSDVEETDVEEQSTTTIENTETYSDAEINVKEET